MTTDIKAPIAPLTMVEMAARFDETMRKYMNLALQTDAERGVLPMLRSDPFAIQLHGLIAQMTAALVRNGSAREQFAPEMPPLVMTALEHLILPGVSMSYDAHVVAWGEIITQVRRGGNTGAVYQRFQQMYWSVGGPWHYIEYGTQLIDSVMRPVVVIRTV